MSTITATDAKNRFGQVLEMARSEPVRVQKNGRDVAVVLSPEEFERYQEVMANTEGAAYGSMNCFSGRLRSVSRSTKRWPK